MRIISQNGFCYQDIPYEYSAFYMSTSGNHIYANCNGVVYSLAEYTTAKKAEKAMQKLHEEYECFKESEMIYCCFRFPQEDEL